MSLQSKAMGLTNRVAFVLVSCFMLTVWGCATKTPPQETPDTPADIKHTF